MPGSEKDYGRKKNKQEEGLSRKLTLNRERPKGQEETALTQEVHKGIPSRGESRSKSSGAAMSYTSSRTGKEAQHSWSGAGWGGTVRKYENGLREGSGGAAKPQGSPHSSLILFPFRPPGLYVGCFLCLEFPFHSCLVPTQIPYIWHCLQEAFPEPPTLLR